MTAIRRLELSANRAHGHHAVLRQGANGWYRPEGGMVDIEGIKAAAAGNSAAERDNVRELALAAVDEAYQDHVKHLFVTLHSANVADPTQASLNERRAAEGLALASKTRA